MTDQPIHAAEQAIEAAAQAVEAKMRALYEAGLGFSTHELVKAIRAIPIAPMPEVQEVTNISRWLRDFAVDWDYATPMGDEEETRIPLKCNDVRRIADLIERLAVENAALKAERPQTYADVQKLLEEGGK